MADTTNSNLSGSATRSSIHPLYVRITHWINALAMLVMIGSGCWLAGGLLWHFAAMWVLIVNALVYLTLALASGRFRSKLMPIRLRDVLHDLADAFTGRLNRDVARYNAVQKLVYAGVLVIGVVIVLSGFAIWKPVQLRELTMLFGGYDAARYVHFFAMAAIVLFLVLHVIMALLVPQSLRAMIRGN